MGPTLVSVLKGVNVLDGAIVAHHLYSAPPPPPPHQTPPTTIEGCRWRNR